MKKKHYLLAITLLLMFLCGITLWKMQRAQTIAGSTISKSEKEYFEEHYVFSDELEFQLFCNQKEVPYDTATGTYYLPQTLSGKWLDEDAFALSNEDMQLYWCEDVLWSDMETAIAEGHPFEFIVVSENIAKIGSIVFTGLPMMKVDRLKMLEEDSFYCKVTIYDPFCNDQELYETKECYGILSVRGKTSQMFPKKGWNLDLIKENGEPYKTSLFGLREDDDWKLNALYPDATKVRESLAIELWNEMAAQTESALDTGTEMAYFELMLESDYHGIYGAMEQLDYKQFSMDKAEDVIYKSYAWPREGNIDEKALNGAYDYCGHLIKNGNREITENLWTPLAEYVEASGFKTEDLSCDTDRLYEYIQSHMNIDNVLNTDLFVQMLYAFDNKYKNLYLNADMMDDGNYTLWKVPWDLNYSFGDRYDVESSALTRYSLEWAWEIMPEFMLTETLLESGNQEFIKLLNQKWEELSKSTFSLENIQRIASEKMDLLISSGAFARDEMRWPDGPHDSSIEPILEFHSSRLVFLEEHYTSYLNEN